MNILRIYRSTSFYCASLYFTLSVLCFCLCVCMCVWVLNLVSFFFFLLNLVSFFFLNKFVLWQPCLSTSLWHYFFNSICSLYLYVSHFVNSCNISDFLIIITFVMLLIIFDVTVVIVLGHHELCPCNI